LQAPPVQKLLKFFSDEGPLVGPPEVHNLPPAVDKRRAITEIKPGMIFIFAHLTYKAGQLSAGQSLLAKLIDEVFETESGFLGCTICPDTEKGLARVVDMFESDEFYEGEHAKSEPIANFHAANTRLCTDDFSCVTLNPVQAFLGR